MSLDVQFCTLPARSGGRLYRFYQRPIIYVLYHMWYPNDMWLRSRQELSNIFVQSLSCGAVLAVPS
jgi:hypothetical protein